LASASLDALRADACWLGCCCMLLLLLLLLLLLVVLR
jgi:hypothetical protein